MKRLIVIKFTVILIIVLSTVMLAVFMWEIYRIDHTLGSISKNLVVFGGFFFSFFSIVFFNNEVLSNINDVQKKNYKQEKRIWDPFVRICFLVTLVVCIAVFIFGFSKTFLGPIQRRDNDAVIPLIILLIIILLIIFIFINSFKIREKIKYEKFIEKEISKIGN